MKKDLFSTNKIICYFDKENLSIMKQNEKSDSHERSLTPKIQNQKQPSTSVEQLYAKFENLKLRIINTDNKRSSRSIDKKTYFDNRRDLKYKKMAHFQPIQLNLSIQMQNPKSSHIHITAEQSKKAEQKRFSELASGIVAEMEGLFFKKTLHMMKKLQKVQIKLKSLQNKLRQKRIQQQTTKVNASFTQSPNNLTRCNTYKCLSENTIQHSSHPSQSQTQFSEIQKKYKQELEEIIQSYQNKISILLSQSSDNGHEKRNSVFTLKKDSKSLQEKILLKQQEITDLQIDNNKLKRMLEQSKMNFQRNSQLNKLLKEENAMLQTTIQKLQSWKKQVQLDRKNQQIQLEKFKLEIKIKNNEIKKMKEEIQKLSLQIVYSKSNMQKSPGCCEKKQKQIQELNKICSEIQKIDTDRSFFEGENISFQHNSNQVEIFCMQENDMIELKHCKSLVFNRKTNKNPSHKNNENSLIAQIDLLQEQNKLLKLKKDRFQDQLKKTQDDEEKFQQQGQILKGQIKRLNNFSRKLDSCALKLLKGQGLTLEIIDQLQEQSKVKQQFYKRMRDNKAEQPKQKRGLSWRK